jgi:hypothetical protein
LTPELNSIIEQYEREKSEKESYGKGEVLESDKKCIGDMREFSLKKKGAFESFDRKDSPRMADNSYSRDERPYSSTDKKDSSIADSNLKTYESERQLSAR